MRERGDSTVEALAASWAELAGDSPAARAAGADLLARWAEPHRRYHDVAHLAAVLDRVDELLAYATDPVAVRLAAWFHDAVYDPTRPDNEQASARLALAVLGRLDRPADEVARLVRLTVTHDPERDDANGAVLCDADLAVLAGGPDEYAAYASAVREEYARVDDAHFAAGRARVLQALLDRPALFRTPAGRDRWEVAARHNVQTELTLLRAAQQAVADEAEGSEARR